MSKVETMQIYCGLHDTVHTVRQHDVEKLIYQYQYRIAEAVTTSPLPVGPLTDMKEVLKNAFCVLQDVKKADPTWRRHVDRALYRRRTLLRRSVEAAMKAPNKVISSQRSRSI